MFRANDDDLPSLPRVGGVPTRSSGADSDFQQQEELNIPSSPEYTFPDDYDFGGGDGGHEPSSFGVGSAPSHHLPPSGATAALDAFPGSNGTVYIRRHTYAVCKRMCFKFLFWIELP